MRVLPTKWRRKPAGIDMERDYVTVTVCIFFARHDGLSPVALPSQTIGGVPVLLITVTIECARRSSK